MEVNGEDFSGKKYSKVNFLVELQVRNCDHIVRRILGQCGIVTLTHASNVASSWNQMVTSYANDKLSKEDQKVLYRFSHLFFKLFPEKECRATTEGGKTILHLAAQGGHLDLLHFFYYDWQVPPGCDKEEFFHSVTKAYETLPYFAAQRGHLDTLIWLLEILPARWALSNGYDKTFNRIFHVASVNGHLKIVKFLYEHHLEDVNFMKNVADDRAIVFAVAKNGHLDVLEWFLDYFSHIWGSGVKVGDNSFHKLVILQQATTGGHLHVLIYIHENFGRQFKFVAGEPTRTLDHIAARNGHLGILKWLYQMFPGQWNLALEDHQGSSALFGVARNGHLDVLKHLFSLDDPRLDFLKINKSGWSLLHSSSYGGHVDVTEWLLDTFPDGWDLNKKTKDGDTIVHLASRKAHLEMLQLLHRRFPSGQVDFLSQDIEGRSLIHFATMKGHIEFFDWTMDTFEGQVDIRQKDTLGRNILHLAGFHNGQVFLKHLYNKYRRDLDFFEPDAYDKNVFGYGLQNGHLEIVRWLLETFPGRWDLRQTGMYNRTVLHLAALKGDIGLLDNLDKEIQKSPELEDLWLAKDVHGWTVCHFAADGGHVHVLDWLLQRFPGKWNLNQATTKGHTVLHVAALHARYDFIDYVTQSYNDQIDGKAVDNVGRTYRSYLCKKEK